jgi:hypothetical protein
MYPLELIIDYHDNTRLCPEVIFSEKEKEEGARASAVIYESLLTGGQSME